MSTVHKSECIISNILFSLHDFSVRNEPLCFFSNWKASHYWEYLQHVYWKHILSLIKNSTQKNESVQNARHNQSSFGMIELK